MLRSKVVTLVFDGPNRAGKTTLIEGLRAIPGFESPVPTIKVSPPKTSREALEAHWAIMHSIRLVSQRPEVKESDLPTLIYVDRLPYPCDLIYRPVMEGKESVDILKHIPTVRDMLEEFNTHFFYVSADPSELKRRLMITGEHHHIGKGEQIDKIHQAYKDFYTDSNKVGFLTYTPFTPLYEIISREGMESREGNLNKVRGLVVDAFNKVADLIKEENK